MKVLIGVHHFPPAFTGGAEWRALRTAQALTKRGHEVRVVAVESITGEQTGGMSSDQAGPVTWRDETFSGVAVRRLSFDLARAPDRVRWEYDNPWTGDHIRSLLADWRPSIFHLISGYLLTGRVLLEAAAAHVPSVVTLTDFWFLCQRVQMVRTNGQLSTFPIYAETCARCVAEESRRFRWPRRVLPAMMDWYWKHERPRTAAIRSRMDFLGKALESATRIISPSEFLRQSFIAAGVSPSRIVFSRQGRDFPGLTQADLKKTASTRVRLAYIGQLVDVKGTHLALEAMRMLADAPLELHIIGDAAHFPDYAARLHTLAAGDARIHFDGVKTPAEISALYRSIDALIVPSTWYENSPNTILEAFAHHTPVIASRLGGMAELVQHDVSGLTFQTGDAADLARQLQRLIDDPGLLNRLSQGIGPVKSSAEEMDELEALYREATAAVHTGHDGCDQRDDQRDGQRDGQRDPDSASQLGQR